MTDQEIGLGEGLLIFLNAAMGGALVGFVGGRVLMWIVPLLRDSRLSEMTLTLALPYLVYIVCEHTEFSGVVAVVTAGLVVSALGR